jgi:RNA polymerase sigma-70 factor (ECF subfamily)
VAYVLGDGPDAEDVTSETFERALRYRSSFDPTRGTPVSWLIGIARRQLGLQTANNAAASAEELTEIPSLEDVELEAIGRLDMHAAVARLDPRDRELVALRYGADLTSRQIGELLDLRTNAVEVALHRVHARLRAVLATEAAVPTGTNLDPPRKGLDLAGGI